MKLAIIGAGWAGLAAAVSAVDAGHSVTVFEAARTPGGRARALPVRGADGADLTLDNGQHILIGAYVQTLALMRRVGVDPDAALLSMPLTLRFPDGDGLALPDWPDWTGSLDALAGILSARGWSWRDKAALLRAAMTWRLSGFRCAPGESVADLCRTLTRRVRDEMIDPLCVSALNTPAERASGTVFLRVLRDALFSAPGASRLLLPRVDLGALLPAPAVDWLAQRGAQTVLGHRVSSLATDGAQGWMVDDVAYDHVVLACGPQDAVRLLAGPAGLAEVEAWRAQAGALQFEAVATIYLQTDRSLPAPLLALRSGADAPAQFVLDRGRLGGPHGLWTMVVSANTLDRETLEPLVVAQARLQLGCDSAQVLQSVIEKRATFACTPGLVRPGPRIAPGLWACGDYVEGPYPATLEGAVRAGQHAVEVLVSVRPEPRPRV